MWVCMWDKVCKTEQAWKNMCSSCLNLYTGFPKSPTNIEKARKDKYLQNQNEIFYKAGMPSKMEKQRLYLSYLK